MKQPFKDVEVLRKGDSQGNRMVVRLTSHGGKDVVGVGVPQGWESSTGPTWAYAVEEEGLTLVDAGAKGSLGDLADGLKVAGLKLRDLDRVIITHGHADHDGGVAEVAAAGETQVWAHAVYGRLSPYGLTRATPSGSVLQDEMVRVVQSHRGAEGSHAASDAGWHASRRAHLQAQRSLEPVRVQEGARLGDMLFLHTPGHSPDEVCLALDGLLFSGDHVLPEITPHPTVKAQPHPGAGGEETDPAPFFGLDVYIRSLRKVADLGDDLALLPAHRLYNRGRFHLATSARARELMDHHGHRLGVLLGRMRRRPASVEELTRGIFERRKLLGGNLYSALSEVVAHLELLETSGDLEVTQDRRVRWLGSENYKALVSNP